VVSFPIAGSDAAISSVVAWHNSKLTQDARNFLQLDALMSPPND
jgi:hypothetical protein